MAARGSRAEHQAVNETWQVGVAIFAAGLALVYVVRRMTISERISVSLLRDVGGVEGCFVEVLADARGRGYVGVAVNNDESLVRCCITGRQALQLAEMLRLAALPGRNLAQARFHKRRPHRWLAR